MNEWYKVRFRLPRQGKEVLIRWKDYRGRKRTDIGTMWRHGKEWHFSYNAIDGNSILDESQVTHWTYLPEPPKL
jgi:hypothetical protein